MRPVIEKRIQELKLENHIKLTGWVSSDCIRAEIQRSRALVVPSFAEGLPVVVMESFALHRPVISTFVAGIPELVKPGISGWLLPPGSAHALTRAMREVLEAPIERLEQMGREGARAVREFHDSEQEVAKLSSLFQKDKKGYRSRAPMHPSTKNVLD